MTVYLDLDRTLFRTDGFGEVVWQFIHEWYPDIDPVAAYSSREAYYRTIGDLYFHDFSGQLHDLGLDPEQVYARLKDSPLGDGRCEFDGVDELIGSLKQRADITILTFGDDSYQRFKASLCPSLAGIPIISTKEPKAKFLSGIEEPHYMVDDKPIGSELSGESFFIQVNLEGRQIDTDVPWPIYHSLHDVKEYFDETLR